MQIQFKAKVIKLNSSSYGLTIPKQYVKDGMVSQGDEITVQLQKEVNGNEAKKESGTVQ